MHPRRCSSCDIVSPEGARFCGRCGEALPATGRVRETPSPLADRWTRPAPTGSGPGHVDLLDGGREHPRRSAVVVAVVVVVAALVVAVVATTRTGTDAIVLGDGLWLPSGSGPATSPTAVWSVDVPLRSPGAPVVVDRTVVVAGTRDRAATVVALDRATGRRLWTSTLGGGLATTSVLSAAPDVVTVATDGEQTAIARFRARSGEPVWQIRTLLTGGAVDSVALPGGRTLLWLSSDDGRPGRALLLDVDGGRLLDVDATLVAASGAVVAVLHDGNLVLSSLDGTPISSADVDVAAPAGLAVVGDVAIVADGRVVTAHDVRTGERAWQAGLPRALVGLAAVSRGVVGLTVGEHVGLDADGEVLWQSRGYPLPVVRDGREAVALVAPGDRDSFTLDLRHGADLVTSVAVERGRYAALGASVVLSASGDDVLATSLDGTGTSWRVTTPGRVTWVVLDDERMLTVSRSGDGHDLGLWR